MMNPRRGDAASMVSAPVRYSSKLVSADAPRMKARRPAIARLLEEAGHIGVEDVVVPSSRVGQRIPS
jgi:hypothetical protein